MKAVLWLYVVVLALLLLVGAGGAARVLYPVSAVVVGVLLFQKRRSFFVDWVLWCWFLSPFLRRVMDLEAGWKDPSWVLLTPYAVGLIAPVYSWRRLATSPLKAMGCYVAAMLAIAYGVISGLAQQTSMSIAPSLLNWAVPVLFAWWLATGTKRDQERAWRSIERAFFWGVLVMGSYGVAQYVLAPAWDSFWLVHLGGGIVDVASMGTPEPFGIRVFSTMNSAGVFAFTMACGLLLLLRSRRRWMPVAAFMGSLALLLTLSRSAWLCLVFGLVLVAFVAPRRVLQFLAVPVLAVVLLTSVSFFGPGNRIVSERLQSLLSPKNDTSRLDRQYGAAAAIGLVGEHPQGFGIGLTQDLIASDGSFSIHDNGFAEAFLTLGVPGALLYFGAMAALLVRAVQRQDTSGTSLRVSAVIAIALASQIPLGGVFIGPEGFLLWVFGTSAWTQQRTPRTGREWRTDTAGTTELPGKTHGLLPNV